MANSIKDGIINYSGTKYKIIGETDKLYIGFANVGPIPRICKINKDLTGGKSKQLPSQYFLDKAIIEDGGTIVVIGCIIKTNTPDPYCPLSSRTHQTGIFCKFKNDLTPIPLTDDEPYLKVSLINDGDTYFTDIIKHNDRYFICGHEFNSKTELNVNDYFTNAFLILVDTQLQHYKYLPRVINVYQQPEMFMSNSHDPFFIMMKDSIFIISKEDRIVFPDETFRHGLRIIKQFTGLAVSYQDHLTNVITGFDLFTYTKDDEGSLYMLGMRSPKDIIYDTDEASITMHGKLTPTLFKIDNDFIIHGFVNFDRIYDIIRFEDDKIICSYTTEQDDFIELDKNLNIIRIQEKQETVVDE